MELNIKDLPEEDRPREKLLLKGAKSLTNAELIATLIRTGRINQSAISLSQQILTSTGNNLNELGKYSVQDLISRFKGIGEAKAISIVAALELGKRIISSTPGDKKQIKCSSDIWEVFYPLLSDLSHEEFWMALLSRSNTVTELKRISQGGLHETIVDQRLIFKEALSHSCSSIILCHNHPSGSKSPSKADHNVTKTIMDACKLLNISLLDHLIIAGNEYYSFADEGDL